MQTLRIPPKQHMRSVLLPKLRSGTAKAPDKALSEIHRFTNESSMMENLKPLKLSDDEIIIVSHFTYRVRSSRKSGNEIAECWNEAIKEYIRFHYQQSPASIRSAIALNNMFEDIINKLVPDRDIVRVALMVKADYDRNLFADLPNTRYLKRLMDSTSSVIIAV